MKRRKKKIVLSTTFIIFISALLAFVNIGLSLILLLLYFTSLSVYLVYYFLNKLITFTNWWHNQFVYTQQFISNAGYRKDLTRNYEVVNVGSNPARFSFFYEDILGENWSTGTQGLDMDLEILRYFHSYLKKGAYVLLPIVPFSSVSGYLTKPSIPYIAKFTKILDSLQVNNNVKLRTAKEYLTNPLKYKWKAIKYLVKDVPKDNRLDIVEQSMQLSEMKQDALRWMKIWKDEFKIETLESSLPEHLQNGRIVSIEMMNHMISFLLERGYKPVLVSPPMSKSLAELFTPQIKETYIDSFVRDIMKVYDIPYLDYIDNEEFQNNSLYFNALFMNLRGRKLFTKRVLADLGL